MSHSNMFRSILSAFVLVALLVGYAGTASAQNGGKSEKFPVSFEINWCNMEGIDATGTANMVMLESEDENGCISAKFHINYQNVTGVGQTTGKTYRIIYATNQSAYDVVACDGCTVTITLLSNYKIFDEDGKVYSAHSQATLELNLCTFEFKVLEDKSFGGCL